MIDQEISWLSFILIARWDRGMRTPHSNRYVLSLPKVDRQIAMPHPERPVLLALLDAAE